MKKNCIKGIAIFVALLSSDVALCKKTKTVISAKVASQAAVNAPKASQSLAVLLASLTTAVSQINAAGSALSADLSASLVALNGLAKSIESIKKQVGSACSAAKKTSDAIKPISLDQQEKIIRDDLAPLLKIASRTAEQDAEIAEFNAELATIKTKRIAEKKAAKQAAKNYVIFSNALGGRIKIYAARKSDPKMIAKKPVFVMKKNMKHFKMLCNPDDIYYIKIENQHGKINKKGKIVKGYHTLSRHGGKGVHYFSTNDKGHQVIINNYHQYEVHKLDYKGKGSLEQVKTQDIAVMVTVTVVCLALIAAGGVVFAPFLEAVADGSFTFLAATNATVAASYATQGAIGASMIAAGAGAAAGTDASLGAQQGVPLKTQGFSGGQSLVVSTTGSVATQ